MIVVSALSITIPSVFVRLRLYARTLISRALDMSDYCILVGLVSSTQSFTTDRVFDPGHSSLHGLR